MVSNCDVCVLVCHRALLRKGPEKQACVFGVVSARVYVHVWHRPPLRKRPERQACVFCVILLF